MSPWRLVGAVGCSLVVFGGLAGCRNDRLGRNGAFVAEPQRMEFPTTAVGSVSQQTLLIRNEGRTPFQVLALDVRRALGVRVDVELPFTLEGGGERRLDVFFGPEAEGGVEGVIEVVTDVSSDDAVAVSEVAINARGVFAQVVFEPTRLDFGNVELGTTQVQPLVLANPSDAEITARLVLDGPDRHAFEGVDTELHLAPGERRTVMVSFRPDQLAVSQAFARVEPCVRCTTPSVELVGFGITSIVDINPLRVMFGRVPLGGTATETVRITNLGTEPIDFGGAVLSTTQPFGVTAPPPQALLPGQSVTLDVSFSPLNEGPVPPALLEVRVRGNNTAAGTYPKLPVVADVGPTCVVPVPRSLDFGLVPEGMTVTKRIDFLNRCGEDVVLSELAVDTATGGFLSLAQAAGSLPIASGAIASTRVTFVPKAGATQTTGKLTYRVRQGAASSRDQVGLKGMGHVLPACQYSVVPQNLRFGPVQVGSTVTLGWAVRNDGSTPCFVAGMQLASGGDAEFSSAGTAPVTLDPGDKALLPIKFSPTRTGRFSALAEAWVNHPTRGHVTGIVEAEGIQACLTLQPPTVVFGPTPLSCGAKRRTVVAVNACTTPVTVTSLSISQASSTEFSVANGPSLPFTLQPSTQVAFSVDYTPTNDGLDTAAVQAVGAGVGSTTSGLIGEGLAKGVHTDRFMQESLGRVDVLFVVDNSGSMMEEQNGLSQNLTTFLNAAQAQGIDYRVAVTTTGIEPSPGGWTTCPGGAEGGEGGRFFPVNNGGARVISKSTPNGAQAFANNVKVGTCHWNEQGLEAAYRALSAPLVSSADDPRTSQTNDGNAGFLRPDARLAVVVISDEDDFSPQPVSFYESFFRALKGGDSTMFSFSAVVAPKNLAQCPTASGAGNRYLELAQATGGAVDNICTSSWSATLQKVAGTSFGPTRRFPLSERPSDPLAIEVYVDGVLVSSGWTFDPSGNALLFDASATPAPGASVEVRYPVGC